MTTKYKAEFFKVSYNKEKEATSVELLGSIELNDDNTHRDLPLERKAALRAPKECKMFDKMRLTKL